MTETNINIPFSGIDPRGRVKFSVLLEMCQEMADVDASKYNLSVRQTMEHNVTWVLRKYRVDLERYPVKEDFCIKIKTYAEPYKGLYSFRTFEFRNGEGEFLGSAYTWWVLIDTVRMRPIRLDKSELTTCIREQITEHLPSDVKIAELGSADMQETWKVRWQDLDVNDHTNHAVYFSWALDTVPDDVPEKLAPMFVEGEFLRPIPRTRVRCLTEFKESGQGRFFLHSLRHIEDDSEYARISSLWK